ncbi:MAG: hypothetical protein H7645_04175 [Candidatus Heimdallarchaeota archaeon]|nr:hypothetical protein [Candidatus Heimdallarchaeota archaeon]MCK4769514.1 hypothetical protein [Candidatus Heimdallarchaeota archaeon]
MRVIAIVGLVILGIILSPLVIALGLSIAAIVLLITVFTYLYRFLTLAEFRDKSKRKKGERNNS